MVLVDNILVNIIVVLVDNILVNIIVVLVDNILVNIMVVLVDIYWSPLLRFSISGNEVLNFEAANNIKDIIWKVLKKSGNISNERKFSPNTYKKNRHSNCPVTMFSLVD